MNCFSVSLLSLLPGCIQSLFPLPPNSSSIWGGEELGEEETERPPERVASDPTTLYAYPGNATYKMNDMMPPISKSPTILSTHQQIESETTYIHGLPSTREIANQSPTGLSTQSSKGDTVIELPDPSLAQIVLKPPQKQPQPQERMDILQNLSPIMTRTPSTALTVYVLNEITRFESYKGVISGLPSDLHAFSIIFHVKYKDGSVGNVYGGLSIPGEVSSEDQLWELRRKVGAAKALLQAQEWQYLRSKHGVLKDKILVLSEG